MASIATSPTHRKLCVNCNICVNTLRRQLVLQLEPRIVSIISDWITPLIVTEDDFICELCLELARKAVDMKLQGSDMGAVPRKRGHTRVCRLCGRSLRNRQSHIILQQDPSNQVQKMIDIIAERIAVPQISAADKLCHPCWLKIKRAADCTLQIKKRSVTESQAAPLNVEPENPVDPLAYIEVNNKSEEVEYAPHVEMEHYVEPEDPQRQAPPADLKPEIESQRHVHQQTTISLPNYRRAANTASRCVFTGCEHLRDLHSVSDSLRATILSVYNFYIPKLARVCSEHLHGNNWDALYNSPNSINTFNVSHVEHVFSFVNAYKPILDLNSMEAIERMDENLFGYWFGVTKQSFISLLREVPRVKEIHRGILGLGAILIKMRTGDSDERLAILLDVPRRTLERIMGIVREALQDSALRHLGS